jgi:uncharacterized delta-60 repeat protein
MFLDTQERGWKRMKKGKRVILLVAFLFMVFTVIVLAAPGDLDTTFGTGGVVTYNSPTNHFNYPYGVAIQSDGKIVVVGYSGKGGTEWDVLILRYNSDGTLDDTFGTGGVVTYNGPANGADWAQGVAIQKDGKIIVVGYSYNGANNDVLLLRYIKNGTLDSTFGTGGVVTYNSPANNHDLALGVAIQNDGKILVVGQSWNGANWDVLVLRYSKKGILDTTFGTGGVVTYNDPLNKNEYAEGVAIQRDGKIVVVGGSRNGVNDEVLILRYFKKGILDTTFGSGGVVTYNVSASSNDWAEGVAIQKDGKIVVVGGSNNGVNEDALVLRLLGK